MTKDATMNWDYIREGTIYMMWREEGLWNVGMLQGIFLSNLV
jgi:hypothetical protein